MSAIVIGKHAGRDVSVDLDVLVKTRALIQANSGGGKSWLIRRIAEQAFNKIQTIILDPEGEYASLREKYGYVLVGKGGETPADPRSAGLVARRLLELNASAVCDLYEMKHHERHRWVRLFLEALVDSPKDLWHPVLVIVDEAHTFAPEKGASESEASDAMISLATRGRKRGFSPIYATQRLGKLRKDAAAELLNILIGQTFIDIDRKRAAEALGIPKSDERQFYDKMKVVEPGHFWALGRAISKERILVKIGPVSTTHAEPGSAAYAVGPPPAPSKIKALLPKLADLPKEAEEKAKTEADLRAELRALKAQLAAKPVPLAASSGPARVQVKEKRVEVPSLKPGQIKDLQKAVEKMLKAKDQLGWSTQSLEIAANMLSGMIGKAIDISDRILKGRAAPSMSAAPARVLPPVSSRKVQVTVTGREAGKPALAPGDKNSDGKPLLAGERRILEVLAKFNPGTRTRSQVGALTGLTPSGGTFGNYFGRLRRDGYVKEDMHGAIGITDKGLAEFQGMMPEGPQTAEELLAMWRGKLLKGERKMLDTLVARFPDPMTREDLGAETGFVHTGGTFGNYLGTLRRNQLVVIDGETVRAADELVSVETA